jgi:hypothetical protein
MKEILVGTVIILCFGISLSIIFSNNSDKLTDEIFRGKKDGYDVKINVYGYGDNVYVNRTIERLGGKSDDNHPYIIHTEGKRGEAGFTSFRIMKKPEDKYIPIIQEGRLTKEGEKLSKEEIGKYIQLLMTTTGPIWNENHQKK